MRLIDADSLKKWVEEYHTSNWGIPQDELIYAIGSAQTIDPVKHGKWLITEAFPHHIYCSACSKTYIPNDRWQIWVDGDLPRDYCPNCGAKMDGWEDE